MVKTYAYGYPRIGVNREYKKQIENFWKKKQAEDDLLTAIQEIDSDRNGTYAANVDEYPSNEMTLYDKMLDMAILLGRYTPVNLQEYYELCRGKHALKMTKWFNTNYHYLVPDFSEWNEPLFFHNKRHYIKGDNPYLIGPFTFLKLSQGIKEEQLKQFAIVVAGVYKEIISRYGQVHLDEPAFVMDLSTRDISLIKDIYNILAENNNTALNVFTYYEAVDWLDEFLQLPIQGVGLDFVNGKNNVDHFKKLNPELLKDKVLFAGLVDGTNVWRTDIEQAIADIKSFAEVTKDCYVTNAGPLYHLPVTLNNEKKLPDYLYGSLSFATEKLAELSAIKNQDQENYKKHIGEFKKIVSDRVQQLNGDDFIKPIDVVKRRKHQEELLNLPKLPTTTIGSFPQTKEVRLNRAHYKQGIISEEEYTEKVFSFIKEAIQVQESLGLDVLVHGEPERSDMVEHFCQQLEGMSSTDQGWIISYGTRCYRPSIIHGDVSRIKPMTVKEIQYAQSLTKKPVKGMLTGAVTIMAWDYVRQDVPIESVAYQIALCLQDEIRSYEEAGIKIVQVDEPAFRELVPIKRENRDKYFKWAINSYNLSVNTNPNTQIHCHMCYSEFNEIINEINQLDFDVLAIEATRSKGELISAFEKINFKRQIGLGVWDIHSPAVPSKEDMLIILHRALRVISREQFWINPDCGLKTRAWAESKESIKNMVLAREHVLAEEHESMQA